MGDGSKTKGQRPEDAGNIQSRTAGPNIQRPISLPAGCRRSRSTGGGEPQVFLFDSHSVTMALRRGRQRFECQPPFAMKPGTPVSITELSLLLI